MQQPSNLDKVGLKRLARFLGLRPRLVWLFKWQKRVTRIVSLCDTDHAGCVRTRKSVSGCALMLGGSTVSTYCKGQALIALSSCEAEYYRLVSATSQMLGLQSILLDCGWKFGAHVWMVRARTSETHRHNVPLGTSDGLRRQEANPRDACRLSHETPRCCDDAKLHGWIGNEIPVRREQANPGSAILSADRDDCCAETWKLVNNGPGMRTLVVVTSCGTGSPRHDEPMDIWSEDESEFSETRWSASVTEQNS